MNFPKRKLNFDFDIGKPNPDPPPFICALCGKECGYWMKVHDGEKKICCTHYQSRPVIKHSISNTINFHDVMQINAASAVIKEIERCKKK